MLGRSSTGRYSHQLDPVQLADGKADLSGDMALRIEKAFGVRMDTLMRMQSSYDIARTRLRERQIRVRRVPRLAGIQAEGI
jgi:plasmid maintenance system antidote protein VapI